MFGPSNLVGSAALSTGVLERAGVVAELLPGLAGQAV